MGSSPGSASIRCQASYSSSKYELGTLCAPGLLWLIQGAHLFPAQPSEEDAGMPCIEGNSEA